MSANQIIKKVYAPASLVGKIYARVYGSTALPREIGNVLALELAHTENVQTQPDLSQRGGGTHAEIRRVTGVTTSMTLADLNVTNIARALQASINGVDAGTAAPETFAANLGGLYRTKHIQPTDVQISKTGTAGGSVTGEEHVGVDQGAAVAFDHPHTPSAVTVRVGADEATATPVTAAGNYTVTATGITVNAAAPDIPDGSTLWVNYTYAASPGGNVAAANNFEVRAAGIYILPNAADIAEGETLTVNYEYGSYAVLEALTQGPVELEFIFEGLNEADSGNPVIVVLHRASQGVASQLALIQESGFANLQVTGAVLQDSTKTGVGISKYYTVSKA